MHQVPQVQKLCSRCLTTSRWQGNVTAMVVDASFTSIGLNYFLTVVPAVKHFYQKFIETGSIPCLEALRDAQLAELQTMWKNRRSWHVAQRIATYLSEIKQNRHLDDKNAFRLWAADASLSRWQKDPVGMINGVGINTFQYLRMMGGIDTVMPDKIVKKIMKEIHARSGIDLPDNNMEFVIYMENLARETGRPAIELCWMTWLIQSEASLMNKEKYASLLDNI